MRIAMIGPFGLAPKGTMRVRALPLAHALVDRGHAVRVVMPPWHTPADAGRIWREGEIELEYIPLGPGIPLASQAATSLRLVRRALAWRPDAVHCFKPKAYAGLAGWALWWLRRLGLTSTRLVIDEDDWEGPGGWNDLESYSAPLKACFAAQERWGLRHSDAVTVASRTLQSLAWSLGVAPQQVHYLPNGAHDAPSGDGQAVRARYGLSDDPVVLLYTRFFEYDVERVVCAMERIRVAIPRARLLVVGQGLFAEDDQRFDKLVAQAGLGSHVVRAGWVPFKELPGYFAAADLALYLFNDTLVNRAKCAVKLVDLLAAGVPVVAEAVGQASEYIEHNVSGLLVSSGDAEALAEAAVALLRDRPVAMRLGAAAAERMASCYGWQKLASVAEAAYAGHTVEATSLPRHTR